MKLSTIVTSALLPGLLLAFALAEPLTSVAQGEPAWTTYHRDPGRSGDDPEATQPIAPMLAWQTENLGAPIYGQPLILGERVYVATVGDDVYALNSATGAVEWEKNAGTPVPSDELPCGDIEPTVGIVGTPVIDISTEAIYAVADTWNASTHEARHVLKGYSLSDGAEVLSTPVDPPGVDPKTLLQRSALNLDEGEIVFGFGGNDGSCSEELAPVVAAPALGGLARFWQTHSSSAPTTAGGVWATSGAAIDGSGDIYVATANPLPAEGEPITTADYDYSDSVVKLSLADFVEHPEEELLAQLGWFEPPDWEFLSNNDLDLGSGGTELLPGGLLFQAGKEGGGYLIDEATMSSGAPAVYNGEVCPGGGSFGGDAYADDTLYIPCTDGVQALSYDESACTFTPLWQGPADAFGSPIVSGGLVWVLATGGFSGGGDKLYGLDPTTGVPRYTETLPSHVADHFASPSAAGGRLFVSTGESVTAYQIAQPTSGGMSPTSGSSGNVMCPPASVSTGSTSKATSVSASPSATSTSTKTASNVPTLLHTHLHADGKGRVRVALRCPATSGSCHGTITLRAKFVVTSHRGKRRLVFLTLVRGRFDHTRGDFTVILRLDRSGRAHLRRHHYRLALQVVIASPGSKTNRVAAGLTLAR